MTIYRGSQHYRTAAHARVAVKWFDGQMGRIGILAMSAILAILYLIQIGQVATTGYDITDLQKQARSLEQENERLEFRIAEYRSIKSIEERLARLNLVAADEVVYAAVPGGAVARR